MFFSTPRRRPQNFVELLLNGFLGVTTGKTTARARELVVIANKRLAAFLQKVRILANTNSTHLPDHQTHIMNAVNIAM
jgi:transposase-like protein